MRDADSCSMVDSDAKSLEPFDEYQRERAALNEAVANA